MSNIQTIIEQLYKSHHKSYISGYGGDLAISFLIIYVYTIAIMYYYVINHIPEIRRQWPKNKCNPAYMPFASMVLTDSKKPAYKEIEDNFSGCIHNLLYSIAQDALAPIYYVKKVANEAMDEAMSGVNAVRGFFDKMRNSITDATESIMGRTLNVMMPPLHMAVTTKDALGKVKGLYSVGVYFMMANYIMMKSLFKNIIHIIVTLILAVIVGIIVGLMIIPFIGQALAAPLIALAIAIMVPCIMIIIKVNNAFKMNLSTDMPHW